jgi:hypothetical protein
MKFQVGDLVLVKEYEYNPGLFRPFVHLRPRLRPRPHLRILPRPHLRLDLELDLHLKNTYGVITEVINHSDAWEGESTEDDNIYVWYSQVDAKTYWLCQSDLAEYEVVK